MTEVLGQGIPAIQYFNFFFFLGGGGGIQLEILLAILPIANPKQHFRQPVFTVCSALSG